MSYKRNKRKRAQHKRAQPGLSLSSEWISAWNSSPIEFRKAAFEAWLPMFGLSKADLSAAPDHCRTVIDVYMWKWDIPKEVAQARLDELIAAIGPDDVDRVLAPFEAGSHVPE